MSISKWFFWKSLLKPSNILRRIINKLKRKFALVSDKRLLKTQPVFSKDNDQLFKIYDYGEICRYRASSFLYKEPETIRWIDSFEVEDSFLDIGANIGIYSLYAATKGIKATCIEPDALNFALLNMNILTTYLLSFSYKVAYKLHNFYTAHA